MKRVAQRVTIVDHICWQCGCCDYSPVILLRYKKNPTNCSSFLLLIFWQSLSICYATGVSHEGVAYAGYKFLHLLKCWCLDRPLESNFGFSQVKQNIQGIVLEHSLSCWWEQQNQKNHVTGNYNVVSNQPCLWCLWQEILWMCLSCWSRYFKDWFKVLLCSSWQSTSGPLD